MSFVVSLLSSSLAFTVLHYSTATPLLPTSIISGLTFALVYSVSSNQKKIAQTSETAEPSKKKKDKKKEKESTPAPAPVQSPAQSQPKEKKKSSEKSAAPAAPAKAAAPAPAPAKSDKKEKNEKIQQAPAEKKNVAPVNAPAAKAAPQPAAVQPKVQTPQPQAAQKPQKEAKAPAPVAATPAPAPVVQQPKKEPKVQAPVVAQSSSDDDDGWTVQRSEKSTSVKAKQAAAAAAAKNGPAAASSPVASTVVSSSPSESISEISVPSQYYSLLIGTKGLTLQALQAATGAKIDIPGKDANSTMVKLTGMPESVHRAAGAIDSLVRLGYCSITHPGQVHDDLHIDAKQIGLIVGPGGANLKALQDKTKTRITLPSRDSKSEKIVIVGVKENVKAAKRAIRELLVDGFSPLTHEGFVKEEIDFPMDKIARLIGPKGQTIKSIQGNTKTQIKIPRLGESSQQVSVVGPVAGVAQAIKEINRLLEPERSNKEDGKDSEDDEPANEAAWAEEAAPASEDSLW